ncbi:hypothetical protein HPB48_011737 [Haemaphysalis longicornis]|uniref:Uncharacterized protein n=1 Tax=Haemaphysalis longicornis TaxID=44386 RepID=A0A9J6H0Q3_HAELO|nr:hypothetical protein HPB48_011737 [Haemaphysalis longicornis]
MNGTHTLARGSGDHKETDEQANTTRQTNKEQHSDDEGENPTRSDREGRGMAPAPQRPQDRASSGRATAASEGTKRRRSPAPALEQRRRQASTAGRLFFCFPFPRAHWLAAAARSGGKGRRNLDDQVSARALSTRPTSLAGSRRDLTTTCAPRFSDGRRRVTAEETRSRAVAAAAEAAQRCPRYPNGSRPRQTTRRLPRANQCGSEKTDATN